MIVAQRSEAQAANAAPLSPKARPIPIAWMGSPLVLRLLVIATILLFWEVGARVYNRPRFLAPFSETVIAFFTVVSDPGVLRAVGTMFLQLGVAFAMATSLAAIIGMIIGRIRLAYSILYPLVLMVYAFPLVTVMPLFVLTFGIGPAVKIAFAFTSGFFPIVINVIGGCQSVDTALLKLAHTSGASRTQVYRHIVFPHMVPSLFTGMRLGMTSTMLGIVLAELYATQRGVGYYTSLYAERFDPASLFALVSIIAAFAITLNEILRRVEIRLARWRR